MNRNKIYCWWVQFRYVFETACLSGAAKLARRQCGEKKCAPCERGRKLEDRAARSQPRASAVVDFDHFFPFSYIILTSTDRGASVVENLGSPRHWDRQFWGMWETGNDIFYAYSSEVGPTTLTKQIQYTLLIVSIHMFIACLSPLKMICSPLSSNLYVTYTIIFAWAFSLTLLLAITGTLCLPNK